MDRKRPLTRPAPAEERRRRATLSPRERAVHLGGRLKLPPGNPLPKGEGSSLLFTDRSTRTNVETPVSRFAGLLPLLLAY
jgi:hypothetical protein